MASIFIIQNKGLFRELMISYLSTKGIQMAGVQEEFTDKAKEQIAGLQPDVTIYHPLYFPESHLKIETLVKEINLNSNSIFIIGENLHKKIPVFIEAGVKGIILKKDSRENLISCILSVIRGKKYLTPEATNIFINKNYNKMNISGWTDKLTERELEIVKLMILFKSNNEISKELFIGYKTVKNYKYQISKKVGVEGRGKLLKFLFQNKDELNML